MVVVQQQRIDPVTIIGLGLILMPVLTMWHEIGGHASACLLTGDTVSAEEACVSGLVAEVTPDEECLAIAIAIAGRIARNSPTAVQLAKDAARSADELPLHQGLAQERRNFFLTIGSDDQREGVAAFLGKRRPEFTGN